MNGFKYIRDKMLNMTMDELALKIDVSKQAVYMWESEKKKIPSKRLEELEKLSGIPQKYFLMSSLTEQDMLEIKHYKIKKDVNDTAFEFEDECVDCAGNVQKIRRTYVDRGIVETLDFNAMALEVSNLKQKIEKIIYASGSDTISVDDVLSDMNEKKNIFDRFADIMQENANTKMLYQILRAMEIFFNTTAKGEMLWGEETPFYKDLVSDETPLIQDLLEVLNKHKNAEIRKGNNLIKETEELLEILAEE